MKKIRMIKPSIAFLFCVVCVGLLIYNTIQINKMEKNLQGVSNGTVSAIQKANINEQNIKTLVETLFPQLQGEQMQQDQPTVMPFVPSEEVEGEGN